MSLDFDHMENTLNQRLYRMVEAGCVEIQNEAKQILSVPAPRVTLSDRHGVNYYVAGWLVDDIDRPFAREVEIGRRFKRKKNKKTGKVDYFWQEVHFEPSPATPGAPPRKLSGRGRASVTREINRPGLGRMVASDTQEVVQGRVGTNVVYMGRHEYTGHPWLHLAVANVMPKLQGIFVDAFGSGVGGGP